MPQLVLASVNGTAWGAGLSICLACDLCIACEHAHFGDSLLRAGLFPGWSMLWLLRERLGDARTLEITVLGRVLSAPEALEYGLINGVIASENFCYRSQQLARKIADGPPFVIRELKRARYEAFEDEWSRVMEVEIESQVRCFLSEDSRAGLLAFLRKRKPRFEGR
jgi:2-(1,2-epoxy-1,2-dihydrophenyl)acetyl-CoA isomerase